MDVEKNGGRLFRRPKLTLSCSAEGKEGRNKYIIMKFRCEYIFVISE
jgi:hypothetical protein